MELLLMFMYVVSTSFRIRMPFDCFFIPVRARELWRLVSAY
jgi:hypothetical protein